MNAECWIMGCDLKVGLIHYSGDLHAIGDTWIFNANTNGEGHAFAIVEPFYSRRVEVVGDYFHRRGVFVFHKDAAVLNQQAADYIGRGKKHHG